uniref:Uncharacterized protein n=1 Tax=Canis lupus familiaris TaxID=9615 RepID=A0A8C0NAY4_CANLF
LPSSRRRANNPSPLTVYLSLQSLLFCPKSKLHIHRGEISKIIRECQEESFWKRGNCVPSYSLLTNCPRLSASKVTFQCDPFEYHQVDERGEIGCCSIFLGC